MEMYSCVFMVICSVLVCSCVVIVLSFFFFKQKTAYEMRISDWSSDVCSSDLLRPLPRRANVSRYPVIKWFAGLARRLPFLWSFRAQHEIGRASCRERVCQYV